jgi:hypothetical protein
MPKGEEEKMKKKMIAASLVTTLVACGSYAATINSIWNAQGNWTNSANWVGGTVPGSNDLAVVKHGNVDITTALTLDKANFGEYNTYTNGHLGKVNVVSGGSLYVTQALSVGARDGDGGELVVDGGSVSADYLRLAGDYDTSRLDAVGTLNIYNGTVTVRNYGGAQIGVASGGCLGTLNIYAGGVYDAERLLIGSATGATGMVNVVDGALRIRRIYDNNSILIENGGIYIEDGAIEWSSGDGGGAGKLHSDIIQQLAEAGDLTWGGTTTNMLFDSYTYSTNNGSSILYSYDWIGTGVATTYVWSVMAGDPPVSTTLVDYQFNDLEGTQLMDLQNDGTTGLFDFNATNMLETTGTGFLMWQNTSTNDGSWRMIDLGADLVRKGIITMEWRLDSWSMTNLPSSTGIKMVLGDSLSGQEIRSVFEVDNPADSMKIRMRDSTPNNKSLFDIDMVNTNGGDGYQFRMINDLDAGTATFEYRTDSGTWTALAPTGNDGLTRVDWIGVQMTKGWTNNPAAFALVDYLTVTHEGLPLTAEELYANWLSAYPTIGSETNSTDNPDMDAADNWHEYAMGGNPTNSSVVGHDSLIGTAEAGGTNYFEYVHVVRDDAESRGITYYLELSDNLTMNNWTNANYVITGTNTDYGVAGFNQVTNRVSTDTEDQQFIRLIVE